jgi:hypothetical protein
MPEETPTPANSPQKGIPPAVYALAGTLITAMVTVLVAYFQFYLPTQRQIEATQTADEIFYRRTETARAQISTLTFTPALTHTSTESPDANTSTFTPTFTATPTRTATPEIAGAEYCVNARSIYVRLGPGTDYSYFGALTFQDCPFFDARDPDSTWIRISMGQPLYEALGGGWVRSDLVRPTDFEMLPVIEPTPTPTPTETPEPPPTLTPTNTPLG